MPTISCNKENCGKDNIFNSLTCEYLSLPLLASNLGVPIVFSNNKASITVKSKYIKKLAFSVDDYDFVGESLLLIYINDENRNDQIRNDKATEWNKKEHSVIIIYLTGDHEYVNLPLNGKKVLLKSLDRKAKSTVIVEKPTMFRDYNVREFWSNLCF